MSAYQEIAEAYAEAFDAERELLVGESAVLLLLKVDGAATAYGVLAEVAGGWAAEFSDFFGSTTFNVARADAEFASLVNEAAYVAVAGGDNESLEGQLHAINRETTRPAGVDPYWRIRATPTGKRYVPA